MTKQCSNKTCQKIKSIDDFYYNMKAKDHKDSWCKDCKKVYVLAFQRSNRVQTQKNKNAWQKRNNASVRFLTAKRRANKLKATPKWLSPEQIQEMKDLYKYCPAGFEVDHIIPLQGREVKGLHVPWNLKYLILSENRSKSNKLSA